MLKALPRAAIVCATALLSGCFISHEPKLPLRTAAAPFGEGGRYGVFERKNDRYERQETFVIKRRPDGAYDITNESGEVLLISFHPLGEGAFVGQAKAENAKPGYGYAVFRFAGNEAVLYAPQCSDQDKGQIEPLGVEFSNRFECAIDRVADVPGLFGMVDIGQPVSKLVRE